MIGFYDQLDSVYVPSRATGAELVERGLSPGKIIVYPRGVDTERFHPAKRGAIFKRRFGLSGSMVNMLYSGRVSKEKSLDVLAEAYLQLLQAGVNARLVIVGDGPYREEMVRKLEGTPAFFTGYLEGEELSEAYASSDLLVFPSATDTFGNVVLEAQAAGIPAIVTDQGGPQENVRPGETGLVVRAGDRDALAEAMAALVNDEPRRREMGQAARAFMERRSFAGAFQQLWSLYVSEPPGQGRQEDLEEVANRFGASSLAM
jgi:glycosyltransferase involved in cell wall biosynthesis